MGKARLPQLRVAFVFVSFDDRDVDMVSWWGEVWYGQVVLDLLEEGKGVATVQKRRKTVERTREKSLGM